MNNGNQHNTRISFTGNVTQDAGTAFGFSQQFAQRFSVKKIQVNFQTLKKQTQ